MKRSDKGKEAGTFKLLAQLPYQLITLAKVEYQNAKREAVRALKQAAGGAIGVLLALFFLFFMLQALVHAAISGLAVVWPEWLAALTIAGVLLVLAVAGLGLGIYLIKRGNPVPEKTISRISSDLEALGEVRVNPTPAAHDAERLS